MSTYKSTTGEKKADRSSITRQRPLPPTLTLGLLCFVGRFYRKVTALTMSSAVFCLLPFSQSSPPCRFAARFFIYCCAWPRGMLIAMTGTVSTCLHSCSSPPNAILDCQAAEAACCVGPCERGERNELEDSWSVKKTRR